MRSARFLLACLALSALAACGSDVTAPAAPATPNLDSSQLGSGGRAPGDTTVVQCVVGGDIVSCIPTTESQLGSGG